MTSEHEEGEEIEFSDEDIARWRDAIDRERARLFRDSRELASGDCMRSRMKDDAFTEEARERHNKDPRED
jgi:hypothetical protein